MDTVTADEEICLGSRNNRLTLPFLELRPGATRREPAKLGQVGAPVDTVRPQPVDHGLVENTQQFATIYGELRPPVAGRDPERLVPDPLAEP